MNTKSLLAKLLNIAKTENLNFQILLNRFASEQFLYRLSLSSYSQKFIFKGGSLLTYLIESDRRTKDLDFSIKQLSNQVDDIARIVGEVFSISVDDGVEWQKISGSPLEHPEMDYPGVRLTCPYLIGKTRGTLHMDMALGDVMDAILMPLDRLRGTEMSFWVENPSRCSCTRPKQSLLRSYKSQCVKAGKTHA